MSTTSPLLFVYGTLRRSGGHAMSEFLAARSRFVSAANAAGRLYDLGPYPGMAEPADAKERVRGEVYELHEPEATLAKLDRYEGCGPEDPQPRLYERVLASVTLDNGEEVRAWLYLYRGPLAQARHIPCGDYLLAGRPEAAP